MIQDFDGPDPPPNRRGHVLVVSVLLVVGVIAGYGAVSSPELRGPFATPRPSPIVAPAVQFIPAPAQRIELPSIPPRTVNCEPDAPGPALVIIGETRTTSTLPIDPGSGPRCIVWWGQPPNLFLNRAAP